MTERGFMKKELIKEKVNSAMAMLLNILPVIFWLCLIYSFDEFMGANVTVLAMIIHEMGHILCIFIFTGKFDLPRGDITGLRIDKTKINSYGYDLALYSAGIIFNFIAVAIMLVLKNRFGEFATLFITINLATAISNMLPVEGYDGYKIITSLLSYFNAGHTAYTVLEIFSFSFVFLMCILSLYLVYTFGNGYWIMGIFLFATVAKLEKWLKKSNFGDF